MYYWLPNFYTKRYSQYINKMHCSGRAVERRNLKEIHREGGASGVMVMEKKIKIINSLPSSQFELNFEFQLKPHANCTPPRLSKNLQT